MLTQTKAEPCRWCGDGRDTVRTNIRKIIRGVRSDERAWQCRDVWACLARQDEINKRERHGN